MYQLRALRYPELFVGLIISVLMCGPSMSRDQVAENVAVELQTGQATLTLDDGRVVQEAPVPDLPYDPNECPEWHVPKTVGSYIACNVVAQAGVPFRGWIVNQSLCGGDHIDAILARTPFQTSGPAPDPSYPTPSVSEDIDIYYFSNGSWPEKLHLGGSHEWQEPGRWSISGNAWTDCLKPYNRHWYYNLPVSTQAMVFEPQAPQAISALVQKVSSRQTYHAFGRVTLFDPAPASGTLVKITVDKLGILDVITPFGRTGLQAPAGVFYVSTYLYIPPGNQTADFDIVVAASANPGDDVRIATKCVGIPGNWRINSHCNAVEKHPQVLRVTIAP